jgi:cysteine desulfurase/selenocysteine lyase
MDGRLVSAPDSSTWPDVRGQFPILSRTIHGKRLMYLDNAATTQKPRAVLEALVRFYEERNANIHRGVHTLSQQATAAYEAARAAVARFLGASDAREVVFVRGTTEAINLVAQAWARPRLKPGDEVLLTHMEHHSNIVPWQLVCAQTGARLAVAPIDDAGDLVWDEFQRRLTDRTRIVAVAHVSNALGTRNPVRRIAAAARSAGAKVLVDGAQAVGHIPVNVREIGCDFYVFSGHKMYGPTGIGALWARREILEEMDPWQGGGDMIRSVTFEKTTYNDVPHKFEAGTPSIACAAALAAAVEFLERIGRERIEAYEDALVSYAVERLREAGVRLIGTPRERVAVVSFDVPGVHPHDVGTVLDHEGIAIRTGHHCAQPTMERFGVPATCRASFGVYNTREDVDALGAALARVREVFRL